MFGRVAQKTCAAHFKRLVVFGNIGTVSAMQKRPSSDVGAFRDKLGSAKHVVVLTGAGISAASGIPTFRGAGGFWRKYQAQDLATPTAFAKNPSLVWEFYHYRREVVLTKEPNNAHIAVAELERKLAKENRRVVVITQNIDELHRSAGSQNVIELHGTLFKTRCTKCRDVAVNKDSPICDALRDRGAPDVDAEEARIPVEQLPRCKKGGCNSLLRPYIVWFGESLEHEVLQSAFSELETCDLCLVVGTSAIVYPAAMFAPQVAARNVPVAEFNIESTPNTEVDSFYFEGCCTKTLPEALGL